MRATARRLIGNCAVVVWLLLNGFTGGGCLAAAMVHADPNPLDEPRLERVGAGVIPRDVVPSLAQDQTGFIWIGTGDGLVRYDGHRFRPQERESADPAARNLGWIQAMLPSRDGRLWIGTEADGLAVYDPVSGRIETHRPDQSVGSGLAAPTILALAEDLDGFIWAGGAGWLTRFDPKNASFMRFHSGAGPGELPDDRISSLLVDRDGTLWVGSWAGLSRLRRGSSEFESTRWPQSADRPAGAAIVTALLQASNGRIWFGTQQGELAIVDGRDNRIIWLDEAAQGMPPPRGRVSSLVEVPERGIWVGSATGIDIHRADDGRRLRRLRHDPRNPTGLAANHVRTMLVDQAGYLWIGGYGLGLQRYNPTNRSMLVRGADLRPPVRLLQPDFRNLLQLDNGEILASTPEQGVLVMDSRLRVTGSFDTSSPSARAGPVAPTAPEYISAMTQAADASIWLAGDSRLMLFSGSRRLLRTLPLPAGTVNGLHVGADGSLWVATQDGLHVLRPDASELVRVDIQGGVPLKGEVYRMTEAADRVLWVGSASGLFRIAPGEQQLRAVNGRDGKGLANPTVIGLLIDGDGALWVDTAVAGLHHLVGWEGPFAIFDRVSERHGVVSRPFGANLLQDRRGRIWSHMYVYDPRADRLHELTEADGVSIGTGWFRSYTRVDDGRFLFGGSKGLLVVDPESFDMADYAPRVVVSELRIDGIRQQSERLADGLNLGPGRRSFSIEFTALDYSDATRNRYAYRLEGYDSRWIDTRSSFRVASYGNLSPGDYLMRVRTTNRSGVWSSHELMIPVHVLPAWWQHWSVRLAALALLGIGIWLLVQWRTRHLLRGQQALERKVGERTVELENVARALQRESAALEEASLTDPLSGLRNRRFFGLHIESDTALAVRRYENHLQHGSWLAEDSDLIFFVVDLDHFKEVNDRYGHAAGDAVIMQMRRRLLKVFRDSDYLIRWGGEEFLILARESARANAAQLAERVLVAIAEEPFELDDGALLHRTCSVGFSCFPLVPKFARALDWDAAVKTADAALLAVKSAGRNGWLGLVQARADAPEELHHWLQRPLAEWWQSGQLDVVFSSTHAGWASARSQR